MDNNFDRMVTYFEGDPPIKSYDPVITWSCKITKQIKNISQMPQYLWPPHLAGRCHTMRSSNP